MPTKGPYSGKKVLAYIKSFVYSPKQDENGMAVPRIPDDVGVTEVAKKHDGINPQDTMEMLDKEEILLKSTDCFYTTKHKQI